MYIAKRDGKGTYRLFEAEMHAEVLARLELRADLQRALVNDEFELYYQPVIRLGDSTISGVEALVRWHHPERGVIGPTEFIPFAEETGLIIPIGRWVLREGCRQATLIQEVVPSIRPFTMNVNISAVQLHHSDIVGDVRDALAESGLPPNNLTLEINETTMMTNADLAEERLAQLKELGVSIALDDFGTGYSSLGYLARFPVDVIKLDRSFLVAGASPVTSDRASTSPDRWTRTEQSSTCRRIPTHRNCPAIHIRAARTGSMQHSYEALDRTGGFSRVRLLAPLRHRDFGLLWTGMSVSLLGDGIFIVALAWQVYALSNLPSALSIVGIAMTVPTILFLLLGGVISDRFERRR
jgi:EAL domain-containing protein (putative c-di-GMP-specific phosphodiesterase class I)